MSRPKRIWVAVVLVVALIGALLLVLLHVDIANRGSQNGRTYSPDGRLVLLTSVNQSKEDPTRYLCVAVEIQDSAGHVLFHEVTPASDTMRWSIGWETNAKVILQSSDVGTYVVEKLPDGRWEAHIQSPTTNKRT
jgi:hypothetical protein